MKILKKMKSLVLSVILLCLVLPVRAQASYEIPGTCSVQADTDTAYIVKTLDYSYDNNTYFSLRDIAVVLNGTDKSFSLEITKSTVSLNKGNAYAPLGVENTSWENNENPDIALKRNEFKVNGKVVFYYTLIMPLSSGGYDCFMMAVDIAMLLDMDITVSDEGVLMMHTQEPFCIFPDELEEAGYFYGVNSVLAGDATTGEIYYRYQSDTPFPIASTSKLMTCLLVMDAVSEGNLSLEDQTVISGAVQALSESNDGVIPLKAGEQIPVRELLLGTLLPSSNECALCLAETVAGSEETFVRMMNQKALDLGLSQTTFYNSHGLPFYTEGAVPSKLQNRMSTEDMFRLVSYILNVYPQITDITSLEDATIETLDLEVRNSNPLLHNMPEVTGLKTGTTNKAGACLVTSLAVDDGIMEHNLVVVVFGTEDSIERGRVSGLLARYALHAFYDDAGESEHEEDQTPENLPTHAEAAVNRIIQTARALSD